MPFTLAHPAAVLPLRQTKLMFSALVIGSMAPDFPYFMYATDGIRWGHTLRGVFLFCLPVGLIVLWLYHWLVKRPLVSLAPEFLRRRISRKDLEFYFAPASTFLLIVVSLLVGVFSHILWDGFTHDHGYFVKIWPLLSTPVRLHRILPLWKALQFVCSAIGVGLVALFAGWRWYNSPPVTTPIESEFSPRTRAVIVVIGLLLAGIAGFLVGLGRHGGHGWKWTSVQMTISGISALCAEIILFSLAWHLTNLGRKTEKPLDSSIQRPEVPVGR